MGQEPTSTFFSHVKPGDTKFEPGGGCAISSSIAIWALPAPPTAR